MQLIAKGAEAELRKEGNALVKERIKKGYRLKEIDEKLRKRRTALEARLLREARRAGVSTPQVLEESKNTLVLEFIDGQKVKDILGEGNCKAIAEKIGEAIAKLHSYDIIHGDLTTSNMLILHAPETALSQVLEAHAGSHLLNKPAPLGTGIKEDVITKAESRGRDSERGLAEPFSLWLIDFGLGFISKRDEDKAVDLYLLHAALESTHVDVLEECWVAILDSYKKHYGDSEKVIKALSGVEKRGRYKVRPAR